MGKLFMWMVILLHDSYYVTIYLIWYSYKKEHCSRLLCNWSVRISLFSTYTSDSWLLISYQFSFRLWRKRLQESVLFYKLNFDLERCQGMLCFMYKNNSQLFYFMYNVPYITFGSIKQICLKILNFLKGHGHKR